MINKQRIIIVILAISLLSLGFIQKCNTDSKLESIEKNKVRIIGTITKLELSSPQNSRVRVYYKYVNNGVEYKNVQTLSNHCEFYANCARTVIWDGVNHPVGDIKCFVFCDSTDYSNSTVKLDESYCNE